MTDLTAMVNIGRALSEKLKAVGIDSAEMLREEGAKAAFAKLKAVYPQVCLVHLYALEAAVENVAIQELSAGKKQELKAFADLLK
jgi:DNA transformation protein